VLFIWFIYEHFIQIGFVYCIYIFFKKIQHFQSQYGSHTVPQRRFDERLFAARTQVSRVTISGFSWACLGRWYGFFEFSFIVFYNDIPRHQRLCKTCKVLDDEIHFFIQCQINDNFRNVLINNIKKFHANFNQLDFFSQLKIILIPDQKFLPSVVDYIKQSLELQKWGSHWSMCNFNYEYMTFLYVVHVYMFCNVVLYCIALPARVLFAIKIII
jgi:hypothetical protein